MPRRYLLTLLAAAVAPLALGAGPASASASCAFRSTSPGAAPPEALAMASACLVNAERVRQGLEPVAVDARLAVAAARHAEDMARRGYLSHVSPGGCDVRCRAAAVGFAGIVGENIAYAATAADAVRMWLRSPAHRANILDPRWRSMGSGVSGVAAPRWAHVFGLAAPAPGGLTGLEPQFQGPADPTGGAVPVAPGPAPVTVGRAIRVGEMRATLRGRTVTVTGKTRRARGRVTLVVRRGRRAARGRATVRAQRVFRVRARVPRGRGKLRMSVRVGDERRRLTLR